MWRIVPNGFGYDFVAGKIRRILFALPKDSKLAGIFDRKFRRNEL
tara:strand:+ start:35 stop:169 length:135 start_codon:yes stop_codon:yes gene_type:complete